MLLKNCAVWNSFGYPKNQKQNYYPFIKRRVKLVLLPNFNMSELTKMFKKF